LVSYIDEQMFRYNNRKDRNGNKLSDSGRFQLLLEKSWTLDASEALGLAATVAGWAGFARFLSVFLLGLFGAGCTVFAELKQSLHPALEIFLRLRAFDVLRCFIAVIPCIILPIS
jgi:hypothetical protein